MGCKGVQITQTCFPDVFLTVIDPAIQEYEKLKNKYQIEKGCRYQAQSYASQIVSENRKLKRQSMGILNFVGNNTNLSIADLKLDWDAEETGSEEDFKENLNMVIRGKKRIRPGPEVIKTF